MDWSDRAVLITGASRGLGYALARTLGARGARVALVGVHEGRLRDAVSALAREGVRAYGVRADVADKHATYRIAGEAQALIGPIDVLVHNASTLGRTPLRALLDTDCEDLERVLAVNLVGTFRLTKAIAGGMLVRGAGVIAHVSSDAAVEAYPRWGAYGVSKAALDQLSRSWAAELAGSGVRVLSIDPGEMDTDMHAAALPEADRAALAKPSLVAERVLRILGDAAAFPSGARVSVSEVLP